MVRHTFATMFLRKNGKVQVLQRLLGHGDIQTTMRYVHLSKGKLMSKCS
ncbi:MAG: tyrosine-type recombinase/integrase [Cytophagaceae bacterium]|nr:tyrosine-type recombinase/integrase [Cytophagaceae bacterium]